MQTMKLAAQVQHLALDLVQHLQHNIAVDRAATVHREMFGSVRMWQNDINVGNSTRGAHKVDFWPRDRSGWVRTGRAIHVDQFSSQTASSRPIWDQI